jgi:hypothetical protein
MWQRLTERARRVVFFAQEEAARLGTNGVGTEHLLLGLVRENEGVGARVLLDLGADADRIRNELIRMMSGPRAGPRRGGHLSGRRRRPQALAPEDLAGLTMELEDLGLLSGAWEYKVVEVETLDETVLNELGADAWQLVTVLAAGSAYRLVLKRRAGPFSA